MAYPRNLLRHNNMPVWTPVCLSRPSGGSADRTPTGGAAGTASEGTPTVASSALQALRDRKRDAERAAMPFAGQTQAVKQTQQVKIDIRDRLADLLAQAKALADAGRESEELGRRIRTLKLALDEQTQAKDADRTPRHRPLKRQT